MTTPRPHAWWPDPDRLYCIDCNLPRRHPCHDVQPLELARQPYRDDEGIP